MHPSTLFFYLSFIVVSAFAGASDLPGVPDKVYGVNLGSWFVVEPWMLPEKWIEMGGENCTDCSTCIRSEFAFAEAYPDTVDAQFKEHWETWFTQDHVDQLVDAGINTVRIPLGYWIVEPLVNRATEFYPRGGLPQLRRGLAQLKAANIAVILDHHALPGVSASNQMFAGRCTTDVQFFTPYNYHRALIWTAVMTALSHLDPVFSTVASIEAVNEPNANATETPGFGEFDKNFVQTIRAVEHSLGIPNPLPTLSSALPNGNLNPSNATQALAITATLSSIFNSEVCKVLQDAIPIILQIALDLDINLAFGLDGLGSLLSAKRPLVTNFMDIKYQFNDPPNPADAAMGPQSYDVHLYYSFGGVADPNEEAYLASMCNLNRIQADAAVHNTPLWFGEFSLSTQFNATDEFLMKWADAQKLQYSKSRGWIFWNFRIEESPVGVSWARQWSYLGGLQRGFLTQDPSELHDPHVCDSFVNATVT